MDIQKVKATSNQQNQSQIEEEEVKILKIKIEVMKLICATFYHVQHRCILSYITASTLQKQIIREDDLSIFQNYQSLLIDLKEGYFITPYQIFQKKQSKKDKKVLCYKLNTINFFKIIRKILTELQTKIEKIKKFYNESRTKQIKEGIEQKKIKNKKCKKCHTIQDDHARDFGFQECLNCRNTEFQDVLIIEDEIQRIEKLTLIISIVFTKLKEIQDMNTKLENKREQIKQIQKDIKIKQIDRFMKTYQNILKQKGEHIEISNDYLTIKQAQKLYAPLTSFQKINQMKISRNIPKKAVKTS